MDATTQLVCRARQVQCCLPTQCEQMSALVAIFAQIAGMPIDCATLATAAGQYACLSRQMQLPALIYLASQILNLGVNPQIFEGHYGGNAPPFSPVTPAGMAFDQDTGNVWNWYSNQWH